MRGIVKFYQPRAQLAATQPNDFVIAKQGPTAGGATKIVNRNGSGALKSPARAALGIATAAFREDQGRACGAGIGNLANIGACGKLQARKIGRSAQANGPHPRLAGDARAFAYAARSAHGNAAAVEHRVAVHATDDTAERPADPRATPGNRGVVNNERRARSVAAAQRANKTAGSFGLLSARAPNVDVTHRDRVGAGVVGIDLGSARIHHAADNATVDDAAAVLGESAVEGSVAVGRAVECDVAVGDIEVAKDGAGVGLGFEVHGVGGQNFAIAREGLFASKADATDKAAGVLAGGGADGYRARENRVAVLREGELRGLADKAARGGGALGGQTGEVNGASKGHCAGRANKSRKATGATARGLDSHVDRKRVLPQAYRGAIANLADKQTGVAIRGRDYAVTADGIKALNFTNSERTTFNRIGEKTNVAARRDVHSFAGTTKRVPGINRNRCRRGSNEGSADSRGSYCDVGLTRGVRNVDRRVKRARARKLSGHHRIAIRSLTHPFKLDGSVVIGNIQAVVEGFVSRNLNRTAIAVNDLPCKGIGAAAKALENCSLPACAGHAKAAAGRAALHDSGVLVKRGVGVRDNLQRIVIVEGNDHARAAASSRTVSSKRCIKVGDRTIGLSNRCGILDDRNPAFGVVCSLRLLLVDRLGLAVLLGRNRLGRIRRLVRSLGLFLGRQFLLAFTLKFFLRVCLGIGILRRGSLCVLGILVAVALPCQRGKLLLQGLGATNRDGIGSRAVSQALECQGHAKARRDYVLGGSHAR